MEFVCPRALGYSWQDMSEERVVDPSAEVERRIAEAKAHAAVQLDLADLGLTAIPESLASLPNLRYLYLENNQISAIPDSLASLVNLRFLRLDRNRIAAIPDSLA